MRKVIFYDAGCRNQFTGIGTTEKQITTFRCDQYTRHVNVWNSFVLLRTEQSAGYGTHLQNTKFAVTA